MNNEILNPTAQQAKRIGEEIRQKLEQLKSKNKPAGEVGEQIAPPPTSDDKKDEQPIIPIQSTEEKAEAITPATSEDTPEQRREKKEETEKKEAVELLKSFYQDQNQKSEIYKTFKGLTDEKLEKGRNLIEALQDDKKTSEDVENWTIGIEQKQSMSYKTIEITDLKYRHNAEKGRYAVSNTFIERIIKKTKKGGFFGFGKSKRPSELEAVYKNYVSLDEELETAVERLEKEKKAIAEDFLKLPEFEEFKDAELIFNEGGLYNTDSYYDLSKKTTNEKGEEILKQILAFKINDEAMGEKINQIKLNQGITDEELEEVSEAQTETTASAASEEKREEIEKVKLTDEQEQMMAEYSKAAGQEAEKITQAIEKQLGGVGLFEQDDIKGISSAILKPLIKGKLKEFGFSDDILQQLTKEIIKDKFLL